MAATEKQQHQAVRLARQPEDAPFREWLKLDIGNGLSIEGYTRGADKTFLHVIQLHLGLDAGLVCGRQPRAVLLTHTHSDHSADLAFLCKRRAGTDIFCPKEAVELVELFVRAHVAMNLDGDDYSREKMPFVVHGVSPGESFELPAECGGVGQWVVEVFRMYHSCPCNGYGLQRRKKRLAHRLHGLTGKEIAAKRAAGEVVDEEVLEPVFAFNGDTSVEAFVHNPGLFKYPIIITECSFYPLVETPDEREKISLKKDKHTAFEDLRHVIKAHPQTTFVLIHASCRHNTTEQILDYMQSQAAEFPNVIPFINRRSNT